MTRRAAEKVAQEEKKMVITNTQHQQCKGYSCSRSLGIVNLKTNVRVESWLSRHTTTFIVGLT